MTRQQGTSLFFPFSLQVLNKISYVLTANIQVPQFYRNEYTNKHSKFSKSKVVNRFHLKVIAVFHMNKNAKEEYEHDKNKNLNLTWHSKMKFQIFFT